MTDLTVTLADYSLNAQQLGDLAVESFGQPLTEEPGRTVTFGFEDPAHAKAFQHCLQSFRLS